MQKEVTIVFGILIILVVLFLFASIPSESWWKEITGQTVLEKKLVAYYKFDDNLKDSSNNENDLENSSSIFYEEGKVGNALQLRGGERVFRDWPLKPAFADQISIAAWVKPQEYSTYSTIVHGSAKSDDDWCRAFWLGISTTYNMTYWKQGGTCGDLVAYTPELGLNKWTHIVSVFEGSERHLYVNGKKRDSDKTSHRFILNKGLIIGITGDGGRFFNGTIDEVRIYDKALGEDEIESLYNSYFETSKPEEIGENVTEEEDITKKDPEFEQEIPKKSDKSWIRRLLDYLKKIFS